LALSPDIYKTIVKVVDERVKEIKVTRNEYDRLNKNLNKVTASITKLTEAQRRTEERLGELAEAQKRTEFNLSTLGERATSLEAVIQSLVEAQKHTEERIGTLSSVVEKLAKAQDETQKGLVDLRVAVGSLADTVGFSLEDIAKVVVPGWLQRHEQISVERLERRHIQINGKYLVEVNLYGEGSKDGEQITILGESKSRIFGGDVESFSMNMADVQRQMPGKRFLKVLFGFYIHPSAQEAAKKHEIRVIASYEK